MYFGNESGNHFIKSGEVSSCKVQFKKTASRVHFLLFPSVSEISFS